MSRLKESRIGKIPHSWELVRISDVCNITSSRRIFLREYVNEGVPFYRSKEIILKSKSETISDLLYISKERYSEIKMRHGVPLEGDILLTSVGTLGIPYIVRKEDRFYFKDGNLTWFRDFDRKIWNRYLYYWLLSDIAKNQIYSIKIGSSQPALTIDALKGMFIALPPINSQRKIFSVLSAYDDLIENNSRRIKILEEMAQAIYQEWFVKFRFPGHEKVRMVDSPLGKIPEGWLRKYSDYVDFLEGPGLRRWQYREKGTPFLNIKTLIDNDVDFSKVKFIDENEVKQKYAHFLLQPYDHVVSSSGTIGRIVTIQRHHLPLMLNTSIIRMRPKTDALGRWQLRHFLKSNYFQSQIRAYAIGAAQVNYGPAHLKQMWIIAPNNNIGRMYEKLVSPIEELNCTLIRRNQILRRTRDLLLPKLISGEIDVEDLDIDVGELAE